MADFEWGLCGPGALPNLRRTRTLEIGRSVRAFNELAVPGLGNVWFGKQLFLATLGVAVADESRRKGMKIRNIPVANAIEALACWMAYKRNRWQADDRLRGRTKMSSKAIPSPSYATARKSTFYVTQPMRMATVEPLMALGFVNAEAERFNGFTCADNGHELIEHACGNHQPHGSSVLAVLARWVGGEHALNIDTSAMAAVMAPTLAMEKPAREFILGCLTRGRNADAARRRAALEWVNILGAGQSSTWGKKPAMIDADHWADLRTGSLFFRVRDAALDVLDEVETHLEKCQSQRLLLKASFPDAIVDKVGALHNLAGEFLSHGHDPTPARQATMFCEECVQDDPRKAVEALVKRDERVLRFREKTIVPVLGVAFRRRSAGTDGPDVDNDHETGSTNTETPGGSGTINVLPDKISHRIRNLYLLNLDLRGKLDGHLRAVRKERMDGGNS